MQQTSTLSLSSVACAVQSEVTAPEIVAFICTSNNEILEWGF